MKLSEYLENVGRPVAYYPSIAKMLGSVKAALFLCQLFYWEGKQEDPYGWIYKTAGDIYNETGLGRKEQETARRELRGKHILYERLAKTPARLHFQLDLDRLNELWEEYLVNGWTKKL